MVFGWGIGGPRRRRGRRKMGSKAEAYTGVVVYGFGDEWVDEER